jgi:DnaJ family protein C protein 2
MRAAQRNAVKDGKTVVVEDSEGSEDSEQPEEEKGEEEGPFDKKKNMAALAEGDLYGLLGLDVECTEKQVITGFRLASLKYHPDKLKREPTEADKEHWLVCQKAYDTLSDFGRRRKYDSSLPFDDKIPAKDITAEDFYKQYSECFELNSKFSDIKPVPVLGDGETDIDAVHKFYNFWDAFKSWREFAQYDEYDDDALEHASDRYEKRYMDKENKKLRSKYEKEERSRVFRLVENAYASDPRIQKELAEEEAAKLAAKEVRRAANAEKWKTKDDGKAGAAIAAKKAAEEAEIEKKAQKEVKRLANKKYRETAKDLATFCEASMPGTKFDKFFVEEMVKKYPTQGPLDELVSRIKGIESKSVDDFIDKFRTMVDAANYAKD